MLALAGLASLIPYGEEEGLALAGEGLTDVPTSVGMDFPPLT